MRLYKLLKSILKYKMTISSSRSLSHPSSLFASRWGCLTQTHSVAHTIMDTVFRFNLRNSREASFEKSKFFPTCDCLWLRLLSVRSWNDFAKPAHVFLYLIKPLFFDEILFPITNAENIKWNDDELSEYEFIYLYLLYFNFFTNKIS